MNSRITEKQIRYAMNSGDMNLLLCVFMSFSIFNYNGERSGTFHCANTKMLDRKIVKQMIYDKSVQSDDKEDITFYADLKGDIIIFVRIPFNQ
jgi:hypothetical protein